MSENFFYNTFVKKQHTTERISTLEHGHSEIGEYYIFFSLNVDKFLFVFNKIDLWQIDKYQEKYASVAYSKKISFPLNIYLSEVFIIFPK